MNRSLFYIMNILTHGHFYKYCTLVRYEGGKFTYEKFHDDNEILRKAFHEPDVYEKAVLWYATPDVSLFNLKHNLEKMKALGGNNEAKNK